MPAVDVSFNSVIGRLREAMPAFVVLLVFAVAVQSSPLYVLTADAQGRGGDGQEAWDGESGFLRITEKRMVSLSESLVTLDGVTSVLRQNDGEIIVVSKGLAAVVRYDSKGTQTQEIGRWGEGPYEYVAPSLVRGVGDQIVVYDSGTLKFIVFDASGNGVDEWKGLTRSITDFEVVGNDLVAFVGGAHDHYMMRLDRSKQDTLYFADANLVRNGLMTYEGNGRMGLRSGKAYYMYPDEPAVREFDLVAGTERVVRIQDSGWRSDKSLLPSDDFEDMNKALFDGRMVKYLVQNSMALGVHTLDDYTIAVIEDGMIDIGSQVVPSGRERELKFFIFDDAMKLLDVVRFDRAARERIGAVPLGVHGNSLLFVGFESDESGVDVKWTYRELEIGTIKR